MFRSRGKQATQNPPKNNDGDKNNSNNPTLGGGGKEEKDETDRLLNERVPLLSSTSKTTTTPRPRAATTTTTTTTKTMLVEVDFPLAQEAAADSFWNPYRSRATVSSSSSFPQQPQLQSQQRPPQPPSTSSSSPATAALEPPSSSSSSFPPHMLLFRHDSEFSVGSDYQAPSSTWGRRSGFALGTIGGSGGSMATPANTLELPSTQQPPPVDSNKSSTTVLGPNGLPLLSIWQGALLLTADCLGTGLLALPGDVRGTLGLTVGLGFILLNAPINWYAGWLLSQAASIVERRQQAANRIFALTNTAQQQQSQQNNNNNTDTVSSTTATLGSHSNLHNTISNANTLGSTTKSLVWVTIEENQHTTRNTTTKKKRDTTDGQQPSLTSLFFAPPPKQKNTNQNKNKNNHNHKDTEQPQPQQPSLNDDDDDDDEGVVTHPPTTASASSASTATTTTVIPHKHSQLHHDTATFDFIGMTQALFRQPKITRFVMILYYSNIFLVLGNYILVMSHAVMATLGEGVVCTPVAGLIASVFMYAVSQSRSMARLGRAASILSLLALLIVIAQCLQAASWTTVTTVEQAQELEAAIDTTTNNNTTDSKTKAAAALPFSVVDSSNTSTSTTTMTPGMDTNDNNNNDNDSYDSSFSIHDLFRKLSALGSVGFAMGSQKLFLNIRHELADRSTAPVVLAISLCMFTTFYVGIILLAGPHPPPFLFDAILPGTWNRRVAGFLLWCHVVVSYAINSQAICSSMDRLFWHRLFPTPRKPEPLTNNNNTTTKTTTSTDDGTGWWRDAERQATIRWMSLTAILGVMAYTVANAIPFFDDLVSLIGSATAVPLTLLLPAIFWRKELQVPYSCCSGSGGGGWGCWWYGGGNQTALAQRRRMDWSSYALFLYSVVFMVTATAGVIDSILQDWENHDGRPFECIK